MALVFDNVIYGGLYLASNRSPFNWYSITETERDANTEWLPLDLIRNHLNLYGDTTQDSLLIAYETATRQYIEDYLGKPIFDRSYQVNYTVVVFQDPYTSLDVPNAYTPISITGVRYYDSNGVVQSLNTNQYVFDDVGAKVIISNIGSTVDTRRTAPISVTFTATASAIANYAPVRQAGLLLLTHFYNNRSLTGEKLLTPLPMTFDTLLRPYKEIVL